MSETKSEDKAKKGIPLYADWSEPEINDPALSQVITVWRGSNEITFKLLRCLEAMRDLSKGMQSLANLNNPIIDKRLIKQLASPLYALASGVLDMFNELESNAKNYTLLGSNQHKEIIGRKQEFISNVPTHKESILRIVRDKIDSHIDKDTVIKPEEYWVNVDLVTYLNYIKYCIEKILYLISLEVYGWTRESGHPDVWSLMSVDGTVVDLYMENGEPVAIINVTLVKSPKYGVLSEIKAFLALHNKVATKCQGTDLVMILELDEAGGHTDHHD